jgi:hypothetical protein
MKLISITAVSTTAEIEKINLHDDNETNSNKEDDEDMLPSTPAKMLDGRHLHIDVSREFIRVERDVICAQNQFELSKVLQNFCNFCEENPLYLRTRKFVPWRQVVADLCREKIILNGKALTEHCISTGPGIVLFERAVRDTLRPFLTNLIKDMDEFASLVPIDEKCPSWWSEEEKKSAKRLKRPSRRQSVKRETSDEDQNSSKRKLERLEDFVRRFTLWTLQAVDRTIAADAFQVL